MTASKILRTALEVPASRLHVAKDPIDPGQFSFRFGCPGHDVGIVVGIDEKPLIERNRSAQEIFADLVEVGHVADVVTGDRLEELVGGLHRPFHVSIRALALPNGTVALLARLLGLFVRQPAQAFGFLFLDPQSVGRCLLAHGERRRPDENGEDRGAEGRRHRRAPLGPAAQAQPHARSLRLEGPMRQSSIQVGDEGGGMGVATPRFRIHRGLTDRLELPRDR